jgi:hypothetical protein
MEGELCTTNNECSGLLVCCPALSGASECQQQSACLGGFFGGFCNSDTECNGSQVCCDLGALGQGRKGCQDQCFGGGGMNPNPMPSCMNNTDCPGQQVCCPGLGGAQCTARSQCFTGGLCSQTSDCQGNQQCCTIAAGLPQTCLDQCF